jgi:hypothetical protein
MSNLWTYHGDRPDPIFCRDSQLQAQTDVMNQDYAGTGFQFVTAGTTRTLNANWFNSVGPDASAQTTMKNQLRQGGVSMYLFSPPDGSID